MTKMLYINDKLLKQCEEGLYLFLNSFPGFAELFDFIRPFNRRISYQHINAWKKFKKIPKEYVLYIEAKSKCKFPAHILRPDLYPKMYMKQIIVRNTPKALSDIYVIRD